LTKIIKTSNDSGEAVVSKVDYDILDHYKWHVKRDGYMYRNASTKELRAGFSRSIAMHRQIKDFPNGLTVDHINGNKLDNRRSNLRVATMAQNQGNSRKFKKASSVYKGVRFHSRDKVWQAHITKKGKQIHLGTFDTEEEAAMAYNEKAEEIFGDFALLNNVERAI